MPSQHCEKSRVPLGHSLAETGRLSTVSLSVWIPNTMGAQVREDSKQGESGIRSAPPSGCGG